MDPHEEKCLLFLCQAVDTFGFEISIFVTVLLDFKMFENVFRCHFLANLTGKEVTSSVLCNSETNYQMWLTIFKQIIISQVLSKSMPWGRLHLFKLPKSCIIHN